MSRFNLRIILSLICCVLIIAASIYNYLFDSAPPLAAFESEKDLKIGSVLEIVYPDGRTQNAESSQSTSSGSSSKGNVIGKISEKFISPYTAKSSYNNVYIKNSTDKNIDIKSLLNSELGYKIEKNEKAQVLIVHTHATETFLDSDRDFYTDTDTSRTTDTAKNMITIGAIVADELNRAGIKTIHDTTLHDYPSYNESYTRSAKTIQKHLKENPDIKIVIDLHRDAISPSATEKTKLTADINGKKAAQIMIVMGSEFEGFEENLKLAVKLQQTVEVMYPSLARALSLMPRSYNQSLSHGSMLIEMGTDANSLEEVKYSAELLANALKALLNTL